MDYTTRNPATGELIDSYPLHTGAQVEEALAASVRAFAEWRRRRFVARAEVLEAAADLLEEKAAELAALMALAMGKPLAQGVAEAEKCAWVCRFYAEHGEEMLAPRPCESDGAMAFVRHEPLGPWLAIMPWNFPLWQVLRCAAPALAAGNTVLLKHAPSTPGCAVAVEGLLRAAGAPEGVFLNLFLSNEQAAEVIAHPAVRGVSLTGSTRAGREVAAAAGRALKPMVLELGGSDPFVVFPDADLEEAVRVGVLSRCLNSGQSCIAAKRFLLHRSIFEPFAGTFTDAMKAQQVGDPRDPETDIGPLARQDLRDTLASQVETSVRRGATALTGGEVPEGKGFYYPPTVLAGIAPGMPAWDEELFGPAAVLLPFDSEEEAVALANATPYGLGASLWTRDLDRVERMLPGIEAGSVFVNGLVKSDPRLPFGGVKQSGFGRELARDGLLEFVNRKTVWVA